MNTTNRNLLFVERAESHIALLGTAHVSRASAQDVEDQLTKNQYDAVAVELCANRLKVITNPDTLEKMDLFQILREKKTTMVLANLALSAYQRRIADEHGVDPGAEMKTAVRIAREQDLPLLLIDRDIGITLNRVAGNVSWWQRFALMAGLISSVLVQEKISEEEIEKLKQGDLLESTLQQFSEQNDNLFKPLIEERDEYMSLRLETELAEHHYGRILAVVGAGHLPGITKRLQSPDRSTEELKSRLSELETMRKPGRWLRALPWLIVLLILAGFVIGFERSPELGWNLVTEWILINGGLCAIGSALAAAHPLTVIVAFLAAPLTSLNPTIGAGFVTSATELFLRKPTVGDFSRLRTDTTDIRGWWKNRVARTLLIFLFSTLGSALGTYIAGFRIFEKLTFG